MIFTSNDGTVLHSKSLLAERPKGSLLVIHGLGEHQGRYDAFAELWLSRGYSVHRLDLRGHGCSGGPRGHIDSFTEHYADLEAWIRYLSGSGVLSSDKPSFLVGHSLGGLIATGFLSSRVSAAGVMISGLILSAPAFGVRGNPLIKTQELLLKFVPAVVAKLQIPNGIDAKYLSRDKSVVQAYLEDPLVHAWVTPAFARALFAEMADLDQKAAGMNAPLLVFLPGEDKVVSSRATELFLEKVRLAHPLLPVTMKRFPGAYHEIFNESVRDKAFSIMEEWMQECLQSPEQSQTTKAAKSSSSKSSKPKATAKGNSH